MNFLKQLDIGISSGQRNPHLAHAAVIYARTGPIVLVVFANGISGPYAETKDRIGRLARVVVDYFDGSPEQAH